MRTSLLRNRRGFSLVEMAITVAIISILAMVGVGLMNTTLPTWRAREAAYSYASTVSRARMLAVSDNIQYRVVITRFDEVLGDGEGAGAYLLQRGDAAAASTGWDTLPVEMSASDPVLSNEGSFDFSPDAPNELAGVGILEPGSNPPTNLSDPGPITATLTSDPDTDPDPPSDTDPAASITWSGNGVSANPASDFTCDLNGDGAADGVICTVFFNDRAWAEGRYEYFTVVVSRGGMVRVVNGESDNLVYGGGTSTTTHFSGGSGSGYGPGGSGASGGDTGGPKGGEEEGPSEEEAG